MCTSARLSIETAFSEDLFATPWRSSGITRQAVHDTTKHACIASGHRATTFTRFCHACTAINSTYAMASMLLQTPLTTQRPPCLLHHDCFLRPPHQPPLQLPRHRAPVWRVAGPPQAGTGRCARQRRRTGAPAARPQPPACRCAPPSPAPHHRAGSEPAQSPAGAGTVCMRSPWHIGAWLEPKTEGDTPLPSTTGPLTLCEVNPEERCLPRLDMAYPPPRRLSCLLLRPASKSRVACVLRCVQARASCQESSQPATMQPHA